MSLPAWFIKQKGLQTTQRYTDMQDAAHARAFTVVKVAHLSALAQIKKDIQVAVEQGHSWQQFKQNYSGQPLTPDHLKTVYQTNVQSAFMAGRHVAALEATITHPYWLYIAEMDSYTRPGHAALHHKVFRHDDPVWNNIVPPNGYNCRCRFVALSDEGLDDWGLTPESGNVQIMQADKGFNAAPYAAHTIDKLLYERALDILGNTHARPFVQSVLLHPARQKGWEAFIELAQKRGRSQGDAMAFGLLNDIEIAFAQAKGKVIQSPLVFMTDTPLASPKAMRHAQKGNALSINELKTLPEDFVQASHVFWDNKNETLVYLTTANKLGFNKVSVRFGITDYGKQPINDAISVFWINNQEGADMINGAVQQYHKIR